jgi:protein TonB
MKGLWQAICISLALHAGAISLIYLMRSTLSSPDRPIVIDLTRLEGGSPAKISSPTPGSGNKPPGAGASSGQRSPVATQPKPVSRPPIQRPVVQHPALEPHGSVPVSVRQKEHTAAPPGKEPATASEGPVGGTVGPGGTGNGGGSGSGSGGGTGVGNGTGSGRGSGSGAGSEITAEQKRKQYLAEHFTYIRDIIERNLSYPPRAQRMGWAGTVVVSLSVRKDGRVGDIRIVKSSGYEILDDNVIETVRKVEPFPRPPVPVELKIPLSYRLE